MEEIRVKKSKVQIVLCIVYLAVMTWIILFKMAFSFDELPELKGINLIPYKASVIVNDTLDFSELIQNAVIFMPFGIYLCLLEKKWGFVQKVSVMAGVSLLYEVLQYVLAVGASDITDLINNTLGGIIGIGIYAIIRKIIKDEQKADRAITILALIGTCGMIAVMGILIVVNWNT